MVPRIVMWSDDIETGVSWYDIQHRQLLSALFRMYKALRDRWDPVTLEHCLVHFDRCIGEYIDEEEKQMHRANHLPSAHLQEHKTLREHYAGLKRQLGEGRAKDEVAMDLLNRLCDWFEQHIPVHDMEFGRRIRPAEVPKSPPVD